MSEQEFMVELITTYVDESFTMEAENILRSVAKMRGISVGKLLDQLVVAHLSLVTE